MILKTANCVQIVCVFFVSATARVRMRTEIQAYYDRPNQQGITVVVVRLPFLQSHEYVNGHGLHGGQHLPLIQSLNLEQTSVFVALPLRVQRHTGSHKRSHSICTFFQNSFRLPWNPLFSMRTKLIQFVRGSISVLSTPWLIKLGCM